MPEAVSRRQIGVQRGGASPEADIARLLRLKALREMKLIAFSFGAISNKTARSCAGFPARP
jgi:hypothetical protein